MSDSEIMLAKTYDETKVTFPAEVSIKLDGVAADFYKTPNGWICQSRQGEPLLSVTHLIDCLNDEMDDDEYNGLHIIGELTVMGVPEFKTAAGIIRRKVEDKRIVLNIYDSYLPNTNEYYEARVERIEDMLVELGRFFEEDGNVHYRLFQRVPVCGIAESHVDLDVHFDSIKGMMAQSPLFEGFMVRPLRGIKSVYNVGKRSINMMRYKPKPTLDLRILSFEEATANKDIEFLGEEFKAGDGLRAVGRIVCAYQGAKIGVGPGCLTHVERRELWTRYTTMLARGEKFEDKNIICEVEYMLDDAYAALRQPVFKRFRLDKVEPSEVA